MSKKSNTPRAQVITHLEEAPRPSIIEYDLYLDESGNFIDHDKQWVVGGYLRPRRDMEQSADKFAKRLWGEIRNTVRTRFPDLDNYALAHCSDNGSAESQQRLEIQPPILRMITAKLRAEGGDAVIFRCPSGPCGKSAELNYTMVLAQGYAQLAEFIQQRHPGESVRIYPHPSRRDRVEADAWFRGMNAEQIRRQYIFAMRTVKNDMRANSDFNAALDQLDILTGRTPPRINPQGEFVDDRDLAIRNPYNLHNTLADYICNSYYSNIADCRDNLLRDAIVLTVERCGTTALVEPEHATLHLPDIGDQDLQIPSGAMFLYNEGIACFNAWPTAQQRALLQRIYDEIGPKIRRQIEMEAVYDEEERLLAAAEKVTDSSVQAEMKANLLLFKIAILNHWGKLHEIPQISEAFSTSLPSIREVAARNNLAAMFYNRLVVIYTDLFDFFAAEQYFDELNKYWNRHLETVLTPVGGLFQMDPSEGICAEYGKAIGSILQTARQRIRCVDSPEQAQDVYQAAMDRAQIAQFHMEEAADQSRLLQTLCDLASEMGFCDAAFLYLKGAARLLGDDEWTQRHVQTLSPSDAFITREGCLSILEVAGPHGTNDPFMLSHYARLASEMCYAGNLTDARILLEALPEGSSDPDAYQGIRSIHPRTQILWKLGSAMIRCGLSGEGDALMSAAFEQLSATGISVFQAISVAVRAEQAALLREHTSRYLADVHRIYKRFLAGKPENMLDPFAGCGISKLSSDDAQSQVKLLGISRRIGY